MTLASRRTAELEQENAELRSQLAAAQDRIPTVAELRNIEQAVYVFQAVAELISDDLTERYASQLVQHSTIVREVVGRQPQASDAAWDRPAIREHKSELLRYLRRRDA